MKISELMEALPGTNQGIFRRMADKLAPKTNIDKNVDMGVKAWEKYVREMNFSDTMSIEDYVKQFRLFVARMAKVPSNSAKLNDIAKNLIIALKNANHSTSKSRSAIRASLQLVVREKMQGTLGTHERDTAKDAVMKKIIQTFSFKKDDRPILLALDQKLSQMIAADHDIPYEDLYNAAITVVKRKSGNKVPAAKKKSSSNQSKPYIPNSTLQNTP